MTRTSRRKRRSKKKKLKKTCSRATSAWRRWPKWNKPTKRFAGANSSAIFNRFCRLCRHLAATFSAANVSKCQRSRCTGACRRRTRKLTAARNAAPNTPSRAWSSFSSRILLQRFLTYPCKYFQKIPFTNKKKDALAAETASNFARKG